MLTTTDNTDRIKAAFERGARALAARSDIGRGTAVTTVRVRDGLTCDIEDGPWTLTVDFAEKAGGNGAGPNPGVLGRAALGSCLATCYIRWAAKLDIPLSTLEVEVQADYDARGEYGVSDAPPGYEEVRYVVRIESEASEAEILRLLDMADRHVPYLDVFRRPQRVVREVHVYPPAR